MSPGQCVTYVPGLYIANRPYKQMVRLLETGCAVLVRMMS